MPKYLDETGLAHFWENIKDVTDGLDERVTTLENSVLVVLGDSWSDGSNDPDNTWYMQVASKLGLTAYVTAAVAGKGFSYGTTGTIPLQVESALTKVQQAGYSASDVKYVVAFGGVNDYRHGVAYGNVVTGMRTTYDNARTTFPNADVFIIGPNAGKWDTMDSLDTDDANKAANYVGFRNYMRSIMEAMHNAGYPIVWDAGAWLNMYGTGATNCYNSDYLHPTQTGHNIIAGYVCEVLRGEYTGPRWSLREEAKASSTNDVTCALNYAITVTDGVASVTFEAIANTLVRTSSVWWIFTNFPLFPGGANATSRRSGFVCSNFANASMTDAYAPIRGYFDASNRRMTLYPDKTGGLNQVFGSFSLSLY